MSNYLELVKLLVSWPVVVLVIFFTLLITSRRLNDNSLVTKIIDRVSRVGIRDLVVELREKVSDQQMQIDKQNAILRKIVAFSMSFHIYKPLKALYRKGLTGNPSEEYLYQKYHEQDFYFLRDHGYIESRTPDVFLKIDSFQDQQNLFPVVRLTKAGEDYVQLREELEKEESLTTALREE